VKRTHVAAVAAMVLLATPALTGCFSGMKATTNMQATMNSGNGVQAQVGDVHVENATVVMGPEGSTSATLTTRIVNTGPQPDALVFATVNGQPATITGDQVALDPGASVSFGFDSEHWINAYGLEVPTSTYVPVELGFQNAGLVKISVLTVPPVGYYEGIAPNPPTAPSAAASPAAG
jgi:copper(I)-binding protein